MRSYSAAVALVCATASVLAAQSAPAGTALRVTVLDQTDGALISAQVTLLPVGPERPSGIERTATVNLNGVVIFDGLAPGDYQIRASADGFRTTLVPFPVKRGQNQTTLRLPVAGMEQTVKVQGDSPPTVTTPV